MLLPHEACTLRPVTFCVISAFHVTSIHRVTAAAGCLMRELYGLRDDCVTDGAVSQGQSDSALRD